VKSDRREVNKMALGNIHSETIEVQHAELTRADSESVYRSNCPICPDGILLIRRDDKTFELVANDVCLSCGQRVVYTDIETLKAGEKGK